MGLAKQLLWIIQTLSAIYYMITLQLKRKTFLMNLILTTSCRMKIIVAETLERLLKLLLCGI